MIAIANINGLGLLNCTIIEIRLTEVLLKTACGAEKTYLKEEIVNWEEIEREWKKRKL